MLMLHAHKVFRDAVGQALHRCGLKWRYLDDQCGIDAFMLDMPERPRDIAIAALCVLCDGTHGPVDKAIVFAMVLFLDDMLNPQRDTTVQTRLIVLTKRYPGDRHKYADWISLCYD